MSAKKRELILIACAVITSQWARADGPPSLAAIRAACAGDAQKLCAGVQPGGGRIVACLKEHQDSLSNQCRQAAGLPVNSSGSPVPSAPVTSPTTPSPTLQATPAAVAKPTSANTTPSTGKEKFKERVITDGDHEGMRAATIHLPEKWHFESKIEWHYGWTENPIAFSAHAENPDSVEAYFDYPLLRFDHTEVPPQLRQYDKGRKYGP